MTDVLGAAADLLGWAPEELDALGARGLRDLYRSEAVLETERRLLFARSWSLVATSDQLASPGDYVTATAGDTPLVVIRDTGGALRGFHNVCRHRGLKLLEGAGRLGRHVTCPYHQWSFGLDGSLARVPQEDEQFNGIDKQRWPLVPAAATEWNGMVFVNPTADAAGFAEAMGGLAERLDSFSPGPLVEVARVDYDAECNWKLLVENHVDVYHLWYLHSRSLSGYAHRRFRWESLGDNWWSLEPLKDPSQAPASLGWISEEERHGIGAHLLFPNLMIVTTGAYLATYDAVPLAPDRTRLTLRVRAEQGTDAAPLVADVRSFMAEDVEACRRLQEATASPAFGVGPLAAAHEEPVRRFHASLRRVLVDALG